MTNPDIRAEFIERVRRANGGKAPPPVTAKPVPVPAETTRKTRHSPQADARFERDQARLAEPKMPADRKARIAAALTDVALEKRRLQARAEAAEQLRTERILAAAAPLRYQNAADWHADPPAPLIEGLLYFDDLARTLPDQGRVAGVGDEPAGPRSSPPAGRDADTAAGRTHPGRASRPSAGQGKARI